MVAGSRHILLFTVQIVKLDLTCLFLVLRNEYEKLFLAFKQSYQCTFQQYNEYGQTLHFCIQGMSFEWVRSRTPHLPSAFSIHLSQEVEPKADDELPTRFSADLYNSGQGTQTTNKFTCCLLQDCKNIILRINIVI